MSGHFFWGDETETHVANIFTDFGSVPKKGFITAIFRYIDPQTLVEYEPKKGHILSGWDKYYVNAVGQGPDYVEYARWNLPYNNNTLTTVYEIRGFGQETTRTGVKVGTFPNPAIWDGVTVADDVYNRIYARTKLF